MSRYDVTTFGEGQLRLTVQPGQRLQAARALTLTAAGSEGNVAGLLAELGWRTAWASAIPTGALGDRIVHEYRAVGVDTSHVLRTETGRVALYFLEPGAAPMPGRVVYDRTHTPFRDITVDTFDWDSLLDTRVLFVSGITTALTASTAEVVEHAVDLAAERGVDIVFDVNHRTMLWSAETARETLLRLLPRASLVLCSRLDAGRVFDLHGDGATVCQRLRDHLEVPHVVTTDHDHAVYHSGPDGDTEVYEVASVPVIDRPGAGDAFAGGTLHGYLTGDVSAGIVHGLTCAALAVSHHGDLTHVRSDDLDLALAIGTDVIR